ncbi:hypothetical protein [Nocardia macrotermitis]|uniref:hypothetical protein n=1 Tax=Nocardia macrotermitis TaxID=2585198 RepID=UPI001D10FE7F|nr:hypothetical protein [Nocardia macrotermitis]
MQTTLGIRLVVLGAAAAEVLGGGAVVMISATVEIGAAVGVGIAEADVETGALPVDMLCRTAVLVLAPHPEIAPVTLAVSMISRTVFNRPRPLPASGAEIESVANVFTKLPRSHGLSRAVPSCPESSSLPWGSDRE